MKIICEAMRKQRKIQGLTLDQLGEKLGVSGSLVGQYERGVANPKYETVVKISKALNLRPENLILEQTESRTAKWEYAKNLAWVSPDRRTTEPVVRCSNCHASMSESDYLRYIWNYCPVCGKKMEDATE